MTNISLSRVALAACCALVLTVSGANAQQPPSAASMTMAKEILVLKQANGLYNGAVVNLVDQVKTSLLQTNLNYQKDLNEVAIKLAGELKGRENEITEQMAKLYAQKFTEAEMRDLLAFYKSPLGRKAVVSEPQAVQESMSYLEDWAAKFNEEVMAKFRVEMKKRGKDV